MLPYEKALCGCLVSTPVFMLLILKCCLSLPCMINQSSRSLMPPAVLSGFSLEKIPHILPNVLWEIPQYSSISVSFPHHPHTSPSARSLKKQLYLHGTPVSTSLFSPFQYQTPTIPLTKQFKLSMIEVTPCLHTRRLLSLFLFNVVDVQRCEQLNPNYS